MPTQNLVLEGIPQTTLISALAHHRVEFIQAQSCTINLKEGRFLRPSLGSVFVGPDLVTLKPSSPSFSIFMLWVSQIRLCASPEVACLLIN